jgi:hypothetical protein
MFYGSMVEQAAAGTDHKLTRSRIGPEGKRNCINAQEEGGISLEVRFLHTGGIRRMEWTPGDIRWAWQGPKDQNRGLLGGCHPAMPVVLCWATTTPPLHIQEREVKYTSNSLP